MNRVLSAYKSLLRRFGPQGWWPTTPEDGVSPVYVPRRALGNLSEAARFEVCLGAILTQNTNWQNAVKVWSLLKKNRSLDLEAFQRLPLRKAQAYLRSSGYFRQKTARARGFFRAVQQETGGDLKRFFKGPLPKVRAKLLSMNGIGPETALSAKIFAEYHALIVKSEKQI